MADVLDTTKPGAWCLPVFRYSRDEGIRWDPMHSGTRGPWYLSMIQHPLLDWLFETPFHKKQVTYSLFEFRFGRSSLFGFGRHFSGKHKTSPWFQSFWPCLDHLVRIRPIPIVRPAAHRRPPRCPRPCAPPALFSQDHCSGSTCLYNFVRAEGFKTSAGRRPTSLPIVSHSAEDALSSALP